MLTEKNNFPFFPIPVNTQAASSDHVQIHTIQITTLVMMYNVHLGILLCVIFKKH